MSITQWPMAERPREKLIAHGSAALSDAELVAIVLGSGIKGKTAVDVSRDLLQHLGNLQQLVDCSLQDLQHLPGIGKASYARLQAAIEIHRRCLSEPLKRDNILNSPQAVAMFLQACLRNKSQEIFACLMLDTHHRLIAFEPLFIGTLTEAAIYPREVIKQVLQHNAAAVILAHNHPSGDAEPSEADIAITKQLSNALAHINVRLLDHIIVGEGKNISLAMRGLV
jgi:DNA repair protein RadC